MSLLSTTDPTDARLLNTAEEARIYRRLQTAIFKTTLKELIATSRLRATLAAVMSLVIWVALFFIMLEGFFFLQREAGAFTEETVEKVLNIFYASLMIMLFFSSAILLYGGIYQSQEVRFLISTPSSPARIFQYKFSEAVFLSGWGFILIGSPMLVAYGIVVDANWYYYLLIFPLMIAFVYIPTGLGAITCLLIVHFFARMRRPIVATSACVVLGFVAWSIWTILFSRQHELLTPEWFEETMIRLSTAENRLFPSWWLCSGLLEAARSETGRLDYQAWAQAVLFFALLVANAMFLQMIASILAEKILFVSYSRLTDRRTTTQDSGSPLVRCLAGPTITRFTPGHSPAINKRLPDRSSRSSPMGTIPYFLRLSRPLFPQYQKHPGCCTVCRVGQSSELSQPPGRGPHTFDFHDSFYFSHD